MKREEKKNIYQQAQRFADVTKSFILSGNIHRAKRCIQVAEKLFTKGNKEVQNVIFNVFIYSVTSFMETHHCNIKSLFSKNLQREYYKQVNTIGV